MLNNIDLLPLFIAVQEKCFVDWVEPVKKNIACNAYNQCLFVVNNMVCFKWFDSIVK